MKAEPGIYVEILIRGPIEEVWRLTQDPELHKLWDLRFTDIEYLPRASTDEPQRFLYSTRLGFGLRIDGEGESTGNREAETGLRTSALRFWSADVKSLIEEGSGYWQYIPGEDGVRFLTWYDYRTRFGVLGRILDRVVFRPLIGWATAWSFDRLRLWIERGIHPRSAVRLWLVHALARSAVVFTWLWHGLVPKLIYNHPDERTMLEDAGVSGELLPVFAVAEIGWAIIGLVAWRWRAYFLLTALVMAATIVGVGIFSPDHLRAAFNPMTLNTGMIVLSLIGYLASAELPTASRCLRRRPTQ